MWDLPGSGMDERREFFRILENPLQWLAVNLTNLQVFEHLVATLQSSSSLLWNWFSLTLHKKWLICSWWQWWQGACSVVSDSSWPMDYIQPARLLHPWNFWGKNTGKGCHFLLQGSSWPRDWSLVSCVSCIGNQILYHGFPVPPCTTWEAQIQKRPKAVLCLTQPLGIPSFRELNSVNLFKNLGTKCKLTVFLHCS